jgi:hypothetical protein
MGLRSWGAVSALSSVNRQAGLIPIDAATLFVSMGARPAKSLINVQRRFARVDLQPDLANRPAA